MRVKALIDYVLVPKSFLSAEFSYGEREPCLIPIYVVNLMFLYLQIWGLEG